MLQNEILECARRGYKVSVQPAGGFVCIEVSNGGKVVKRRFSPSHAQPHWIGLYVRECREELECAEPKEYTVTFQCEPSALAEIHRKACSALFAFNADGIMGFPPKSVMLYRHSWSRREDGLVDFELLLVRDEFIDNGVRGVTSFSFIPADTVIEPPLEMSPKGDKPLLLEGERAPEYGDPPLASLANGLAHLKAVERMHEDIFRSYGLPVHVVGDSPAVKTAVPDLATRESGTAEVGSKPCPRCNDTREIALFNGTSPCPDCVE